MAEYINREDLLKVLPPKCNAGDIYALAYNTCLNVIKMLIKEAPAADFEPVVRCKKCKHCKTAQDVNNAKRTFFICLMTNDFVSENHFCGYGKEATKNE